MIVWNIWFLFLLFQGVAMPAMNNLLSKWVPVAERSRSLALVYSGMYLGSVTGLAFSPFLIHEFGWPSVFYSFGSLGTVWVALWLSKVTISFCVHFPPLENSIIKFMELIFCCHWVLVFHRNGIRLLHFEVLLQAHSSPLEDPQLRPEEKKLILRNSVSKEPVKSIPWRLILSKSPVWALIVCHFCHNWGTFILLTWMPTYYNQVNICMHCYCIHFSSLGPWNIAAILQLQFLLGV